MRIILIILECFMPILMTARGNLYLAKDSSGYEGWETFKRTCEDLYFVNDTNNDLLQRIKTGCGIEGMRVWTGNLEISTNYVAFKGCFSIKTQTTNTISLEKPSVAWCVYNCNGSLPVGLQETACLCIKSTITNSRIQGPFPCKPCRSNQGEICGVNGTYAIYDKSAVTKLTTRITTDSNLCIASSVPSLEPIKAVNCQGDITGICGNNVTTKTGSWIKNMFACMGNGFLLTDVNEATMLTSNTDYILNSRKYSIKIASREYNESQCTKMVVNNAIAYTCKCGYLDTAFDPPKVLYVPSCIRVTTGSTRITTTSFLCEENVTGINENQNIKSTLCNLNARESDTTSILDHDITTIPSKGNERPKTHRNISPTPSQSKTSVSSASLAGSSASQNNGTLTGTTPTMKRSNQPDITTLRQQVSTSTKTLPIIIAGCLTAVLVIAGLVIIFIYCSVRRRSSLARKTESDMQMRNASPNSRRSCAYVPSYAPASLPVYAKVKKRSNLKSCAHEEPSECSNRESLSRGSDVYVASEDNNYDHLGARRMKAHEDDGTNVYSLGLKPQHDTEGEYYSQTPTGHTEDDYDHVGEQGLNPHEDDDTNEYSLGLKPEDYKEEGEYNSSIFTYVNTHLNDGSNVYDKATNF